MLSKTVSVSVTKAVQQRRQFDLGSSTRRDLQVAAPSKSASNRTLLQVSALNINPIGSNTSKLAERSVLCRIDMRRDDNFGARDVREDEKESNFGERQIGHADTEHLVQIPEGARKMYTLSEKECTMERGSLLLDEAQVLIFMKQIKDWNFVTGDDGIRRLRMEKKTVNFEKALELCNLCGAVGEKEGHHPDLHLTGWNNFAVEVYSHSAGGLTENDFILASKIDLIDMSEHVPKPKPRKQKFWA